MLARGGIGPVARGARARGWTVQAHVEAPPGAVGDVADAPVAATAASVRQVSPAHGLGVLRGPARQIGGRRGEGGHESSSLMQTGTAGRRWPFRPRRARAGAGKAMIPGSPYRARPPARTDAASKR